MAKTKDTRHKALVDFHKQTTATISALKKPTKESIEKAFTNAGPSDLRALIGYTGYYSISTAKGAFLSIDTNENFYQISKPVTVSLAFITITVSLDGKNQETYQFGNTSTFKNGVLIIPGILNITLVRNYANGILVTFTG